MPLNFNPYQSTYVDPGSVSISETLRTRFADNLKADDEFSQSIADMISLTPDEGAKAALEDKYRAILDERADKGDYENMGTQILRDARKFTTEYQPILQNAETRASIVENLKARRDKGDITSGMFDDAMAEMDAEYAATGGVANEGTYNERQVAKFVNVNERIFDRIKKLDKDAVGGFEVNYLNLSPEEIAARGAAGQLGVGYDPEATYTYKTKDGITKYVPQEDIEAAFNSIMDEPDVREFMLQDARYSVNRMDDEEVVKVATDQAADFRQKAEATTDQDMKRYYNESAGKIEEQLNNPEGVNMEAVRGIAMESTYVNNQSPLFRTALAIPGVEQTGGSRILEYDALWLKSSKDNAVVPFDTGVSGAIQQNYAASGLTLNEKNKYRENRENLLNDMKAPGYYDDTLGAGITFDTLSTMTEAEFVQMKGGATKEELALFNSAKNQQLEIMGELAAMDRLMAETMEATGQTEAARMASLREVKGGAELLDVVAKVFPNANQEEQWRLLKAYMTGNVGTGANQISMDAIYQLADHPEGFGRTVTGFFGTKDLANREFAGRNVDDIMSDMNGAIEFSDQTINDYLNEVGTRQYTPTVYTSVPGMTVKQRSEVDRLFKGTNPHKRGTVFVSPKTGELVAFDQFLAEQEDAYDFLGQPKSEKFDDAMKSAKQVGAVMYNPANVGPGGGTIAVTYEVEIDGKTKQFEAQIPFTHIDSPAIKEYTSGTAYQFLRQASTQRNHGIERPLVTVLTAGGERVQVEVNFDNRTITPQSGQLEGRIMSLDAAMADDGFIANLNLSGDRIVAN
tara:strand:- start:367 stop:2766 length:2400 start_codon:yes stop_codon:yes gene_type:complete